MLPLSSFDELLYYQYKTKKSPWIFVLLFNPLHITKAGESLLRNIDLLERGTADDCDIFIPGFFDKDYGNPTKTRRIANRLRMYCKYEEENIDGFQVDRIFELGFKQKDFNHFYKTLQTQTDHKWLYSGQCELLIFNIEELKNSVNHFINYNLEDIIMNKRNVSAFLRGLVDITKASSSLEYVKANVNQLYSDLILPSGPEDNYALWSQSARIFNDEYQGKKYVFLSFSSEDYEYVYAIRKCLQYEGIKCWMAPFDIPYGTNYAFIVDHAIKDASLFTLFLSPKAANSVWVAKEVKSAVQYFQREAPYKLCIAKTEDFDPSSTPIAGSLDEFKQTISLTKTIDDYKVLKSLFQKYLE